MKNWIKVLGGVVVVALIGGVAYFSNDKGLFKGFSFEQIGGPDQLEVVSIDESSFSLNEGESIIGSGGLVIGGGEDLPDAPEFNSLGGPELLTTTAEFLTPLEGEVLDNASNEQGVDPLEWKFDWTDVPNATNYEVVVERAGDSRPFIREFKTVSQLDYSQTYAPIGENELTGWKVKVRAQINGDWFAYTERSFSVEKPGLDVKPKTVSSSSGGTGSSGGSKSSNLGDYGILNENPGFWVDQSVDVESLGSSENVESFGSWNGTESLMASEIVRLSSPANGAELDNDKGDEWKFSWVAVPDADRYEVAVDGPKGDWHLGGFSNTNSYTHNVKFYVPADRLKGWEWKVRFERNGKWSDWSDVRNFNLDVSEEGLKDSVPKLISPLEYETIDNGSGRGDSLDWPAFKWEPVVGAEAYILEIKAPDGKLTNSTLLRDLDTSYRIEKDSNGILANTWRLPVNGHFGSDDGFTWRVAAIVAGRQSEWSDGEYIFLEEAGVDDSCPMTKFWDLVERKCLSTKEFKVTWNWDSVHNPDRYIYYSRSQVGKMSFNWRKVPNVKAYQIFLYGPNGTQVDKIEVERSQNHFGLSPSHSADYVLSYQKYLNGGGKNDGWSWKVRAVLNNDGKSSSSDLVRFNFKESR